MESYTTEIVRTLKSGIDTKNIGPMKAYMKNQFDFLGIKSPERRELIKPYLTRSALPPKNELWPIIFELWEMPEREFQYVAMELFSRYNRMVDKNWIGHYEYMITHKSWWDTVDFIAATLAGNYFRQFPERIPEVTNRWMQSGDIWLQRSCILFQLKYKAQTDTVLLTSFLLPLAESREFFIAKAIGWALREYSKTDSEWVRSFIENHELQPLSRKEGLKRIS